MSVADKTNMYALLQALQQSMDALQFFFLIDTVTAIVVQKTDTLEKYLSSSCLRSSKRRVQRNKYRD